MNYVIDIILIAIAVLIILRAWRRGLVKSVIGLVCDAVAAVVAYALTPIVSEFLCKSVFLTKVAEGLESVVRSASSTPAGADVSSFISGIPSSLAGTLDKYNIEDGELQNFVSGLKDTGETAVKKVSEFIAKPTTYILSNALAFIAIFVVALILLRLLSKLVLVVFKAPVIRTADRTAGLIFGILNALLVVWILSLAITAGVSALGTYIPSWFGEAYEHSFILKFFAKFNPITVLNNVLERVGS